MDLEYTVIINGTEVLVYVKHTGQGSWQALARYNGTTHEASGKTAEEAREALYNRLRR